MRGHTLEIMYHATKYHIPWPKSHARHDFLKMTTHNITDLCAYSKSWQ